MRARNDEQLANLVFLWSLTEKWKLEPYLEASDSVGKAWLKWVVFREQQLENPFFHTSCAGEKEK
jgi:hypothetical protein